MVILGVTGQTGAGKTTLLEAVSRLGGTVIDCDALYWKLLASDQTMKRDICAFFSDILDENQGIDRKKLGAQVFSNEEKLKLLNEITHPIIMVNVDKLIEEARKNGCKVVAIDAIALIESGLSSKCDEVIGVVAPKEIRISRIIERDSISEDYAKKRVAAQKGEDFFRKNASYVVENQFSEKEEFLEFALNLVKNILKIKEIST